MIGSGVIRTLSPFFETAGTMRGNSKSPALSKFSVFAGIDIRNAEKWQSVFQDFRPDVVINCIGLVKQKYDSDSNISGLELNSLFPHRLSAYCDRQNARLILMSTDCVFSGSKGNYTETDIPDAIDHYGRTKILGEIGDHSHVLTIRTSTIGLEQNSAKGLIEWFLAQESPIRGFSKAIYSGLTTTEFGRVVRLILSDFKDLSGIWHISSNPTSKFELLSTLKKKLKSSAPVIEKDETFTCDRSLNSEKFRKKTQYTPPAWDEMLEDLAEEIQSRRQK